MGLPDALRKPSTTRGLFLLPAEGNRPLMPTTLRKVSSGSPWIWDSAGTSGPRDHEKYDRLVNVDLNNYANQFQVVTPHNVKMEAISREFLAGGASILGGKRSHVGDCRFDRLPGSLLPLTTTTSARAWQ